jgi:hypothetical protein
VSSERDGSRGRRERRADEFAKMSKGGRVIEGGGRTDVTNSANPDAFPAENGIF